MPLTLVDFSITCWGRFSKRFAEASAAVTMKGQLTLTRELLQHLGIKPGERVAFDKLPGGELRVRAARPTGSIDGFLGLLAGGDFADGITAYEGSWSGGETFVSFDKHAAKLLAAQGQSARLL